MAELTYERALWSRYETIHAVTYFAPSCREAAAAAGTKGFWMGYFGCRAAPMGAVSAGTVEATFFNFASSIVRRAVPDVWSFAEPSTLVRVRATAAAAALRTACPEVDRLAGPVNGVLDALELPHGGGLALYAANRDLPPADDPVERLWQHCTTLREHRGDGHVAALVAEGVDGCEAHLLIAADDGTPGERIRGSRGWAEDEWAAAGDRLRVRGLLDGDGALTERGRDLRRRVEAATDRRAATLTSALSEAARTALPDALHPIALAVAGAEVIAYPNPIGLDRLT